MTTKLLPKLNGTTPEDLYDWAKRIIVYFERDEGAQASALVGGSITANPAAIDLDPDHWGVFKNTTAGTVYLAYNDGGTIKKVQLT